MEILNYKEVGKGCLVAKFDIRINEWGMLLRGCAYFRKEGDNKEWLGLPSSKLEGKDGTSKSYEHVVFDKPIKARLEASCLEKIRSGQYKKKEEQATCNTPF
jgi:hypothetical protein